MTRLAGAITPKADTIGKSKVLEDRRSSMLRGKVKWFDAKKGFGFIAVEAGAEVNDGKDVFVHFSEIQGDGFKILKEGEEVEFSIEVSPKGTKAVGIKIIKSK
jgi:cold shock protein